MSVSCRHEGSETEFEMTRPNEVGDAYGRERCWRDEQRRDERERKKAYGRGQRRIESQNVRGFKPESRKQWIGAWRRTPVAKRPMVWLVQETHVSSAWKQNS
jgi:hypothetical protein